MNSLRKDAWKTTKSVEYWLEGLAKKTKENYTQDFPHFLKRCEELGLTTNPDEILALRKQDRLSEDPKTRRRWEHIIKSWYVEMYEDKNIAPYTASSKLRTVRSFFARNEYDLKFKKQELPAPHPIQVEYIPTNEEIRVMFELASSTRDRALLLVLTQTGLAIEDVASWDIERFRDVLKSETHYFEYYRGKTKILVQGCLGEDCCVALRNYLTTRNHPSEGPVFVAGTFHSGKRITRRTITEAMQKLADLAELPSNFKVKYLRDHFRDCCERANIPSETTKAMMGWTRAGASKFYRISKYTVIEAYKKAYQYLTINHSAKASEKYATQIASFNAQLLKVISTSDDPKMRKSAGILLSEIDNVSLDLEEKRAFPTFKSLIKRALENEDA